MTEGQTLYPIKRRLTLPNDIETIPELNVFVDGFAEEAGLDMAFTMSLNLAVEEAVVNVMSYAYPEGTVGYVDIEMKIDNGKLYCTLSDTGTPFDPTLTPDANITLPAEERAIGGLGIHLTRQIMDDIKYAYRDGHNILEMTKQLDNI